MVQSIPTVNKCCCCIELSPGGIILGFFYVIVGSMVLGMLMLPFLVALWLFPSMPSIAFAVLPSGDITAVLITIMAAVIFIMGIYEKSPTMCLPFVILLGVHIPVLVIESICYLNVAYVVFAVIDTYWVFIAYSVYYSLRNGDQRAAYGAPKNTGGVGHEQHFEMGGPAKNTNNNAVGGGYQAAEFKGADHYWTE